MLVDHLPNVWRLGYLGRRQPVGRRRDEDGQDAVGADLQRGGEKADYRCDGDRRGDASDPPLPPRRRTLSIGSPAELLPHRQRSLLGAAKGIRLQINRALRW
jgi:hypothetical protein